MLQIVKAKVNGKDGFICTILENGKPQNIVFTDKKEVLSLLDNL